MSRYHSICDTCGIEDTNDGTFTEVCGHPIWTLIDTEEIDTLEDTSEYVAVGPPRLGEYSMKVVTALENLMKAVSDSDYMTTVLSDAIKGAKEALGYDPTKQLRDYDVAVRLTVEAHDPHEATRVFEKLYDKDNGDWEYEVIDNSDGSITIVNVSNRIYGTY